MTPIEWIVLVAAYAVPFGCILWAVFCTGAWR